MPDVDALNADWHVRDIYDWISDSVTCPSPTQITIEADGASLRLSVPQRDMMLPFLDHLRATYLAMHPTPSPSVRLTDERQLTPQRRGARASFNESTNWRAATSRDFPIDSGTRAHQWLNTLFEWHSNRLEPTQSGDTLFADIQRQWVRDSRIRVNRWMDFVLALSERPTRYIGAPIFEINELSRVMRTHYEMLGQAPCPELEPAQFHSTSAPPNYFTTSVTDATTSVNLGDFQWAVDPATNTARPTGIQSVITELDDVDPWVAEYDDPDYQEEDEEDDDE